LNINYQRINTGNGGDYRMKWKKFIAEYQEIKTWLEQQGYSDPDKVLLRVIILISTTELQSEELIGRAVLPHSLPETVIDAAESTGIELPERLFELVQRWKCTLPRDCWLLGEVYEKMAASRRTKGLFYTAPEVIDYIIDKTVEDTDILVNPNVKILDPACGCGYFLLRAYDALWQKYLENREQLVVKFPGIDWTDGGIHRHIITNNLWGADIDPVAAEISAACLLLKKPQDSKGLRPNILICDSLRRPREDAAFSDRAFWSARYNYVIGNPPYLSFGLRGAQKLDPDYEKYLREAFSASAEYKLSYYVLFMERGIEMLENGGKLGFIVPDSFLLGRYYSKIRRYILESTAIQTIAHITSPVFKNVSVGMSAICILVKEPDSKLRSGNMVEVFQTDKVDGASKKAAGCQISQSYYLKQPYNRFRVFPNLTVKNLIDKIDSSSTPLGKFSSGHSGIRSVTKQSDIISTETHGDSWKRGLVSGGQIQRYGIKYEGHWLNIDPVHLYKGGWNPAIIEQRKILLRQTGYTLTACIDENGLYHLNNIHSFILTSDAVTLDYLLLLINSKLMSFYYHAVSMEYGRAMAQTDIDTLELLPIIIHQDTSQRSYELVRIMQSLVTRQIAGEPGLSGKVAAIDDLFNQMVYRIYALTDAEVACIEEYETKLAARSRNSRESKWPMMF
jgi:hypothetical protein